MDGSRNKCVRQELHVLVIKCVEGVVEWTERRRGSAKIRVRIPVKDVPFWLQMWFRALL